MEKKITRMQAFMTAVGIMIGVGIYFKADDILLKTNGNFALSMLIWGIICIGFVLSGIAATAIAQHANPEGGLVGYYEQFFSKKLGFVVGWFQLCVYTPVMISVLASVVINYFSTIIGINPTQEVKLFMGIGLILIVTFWNYLSTKLATLISVSATSLKVIPLILISIYGLFFGNYESINLATSSQHAITTTTMLAPFIAIAFMFDGWINVSSLAVDMKNPKKDLPIVYTASIIAVCIVYVVYFVGVNLLLPTEQIMNLGNDYLFTIFNQMFGVGAAKFVLVFVVVSGIGTLNAIFMSGNRYIEKLADDNLMFCSNFFKKRTKQDTPFNASILTVVLTIITCVILYLQSTGFSINGYEVFNGILLEDAVVAISSTITGLAFLINFKLYKQGKLKIGKGIIIPAIALIFHLLILFSFLICSENIINSVGSIILIGLIILVGLFINRKELTKFSK